MLLIAPMMMAGGCRSYERQPLDVVGTRNAWLARLPSDETAREFADRLARSEGSDSTNVFDPSDGLTLAEAEPVALVFNRELRLARLEAGVTRATADNAGLWDDPVLGVDIERIVSGVPDPWVIAKTIQLTIPVSGRLAAEKGRARAEFAAELQRVAAKEWGTRTSLRESWVQWSAEATRLSLAHDLIERLRAVAALADRQEQAGVMSRIDTRLFRVELAASEAGVIGAQARTLELELQLRDILGLAPGAPVRFVETLSYTPRGTDPAWQLGALESGNPELLSFRDAYEAAEQSLRTEVRKQYPDLTIGPGFGTDQGDDRVLLGVRLPLPIWNRNQQGVARATAQRDAARARFESSYEHLASRLAIVQTRYDAGRLMREAVQGRVLPLADEQEADVRRVADLGRVEPFLLLQALKSQYEAKVRLVDARAGEAVAAIRLDELVGPPTQTPPDHPPDHRRNLRDTHTPSQGGRP